MSKSDNNPVELTTTDINDLLVAITGYLHEVPEGRLYCTRIMDLRARLEKELDEKNEE